MKRILAVATLLVAGAATGCQSPDTQASPGPAVSSAPVTRSEPSPSRPQSPLPSPSASLPDSFAEGTQPSSGPLVFVRVIDWLGEAEVSESDVTFHLTEHCAYLHGPPTEPVLLVWQEGQAWIDAATPSTVQFREPVSGKLRRLTDGQRVNLGGYRIGGQGYTYDPVPHGSCPANGNDFVVQEVR
ncbi:hypothetical protein [Actinoplanes aureus]|jgi:hypothetical protein|uniref:Uncharacterized protein n=1 Tax=Actinoplanes aureus TaxID=2792083 RepID=A0A931C8Q7_9ACTN|nr:hypothetical protein [Actinoplanes aureus]MBG0560410.1 hypothetical protein [Actinoplanes aureus]